jgi:hypothetical protein
MTPEEVVDDWEARNRCPAEHLAEARVALGTRLPSLLPGLMVWDHGDEFGDARSGGMVVRVEADADGETQVVVITDEQTQPRRRPSLIVHHQDGRKGAKRPAYEDIGVVARLVRVPVADIDPAAADGFRHHAKVLDHARKALFAAAVALLPDYFNPHTHDEMVSAYRILRAEAQMLERGAA